MNRGRSKKRRITNHRRTFAQEERPERLSEILEDQREEELQHRRMEEFREEEKIEKNQREAPLAVAFVTNLPYHYTESLIMECFEQELIKLGEDKDQCIDVKFIRKKGKEGKNGTAIIAFANQETLNALLKKTPIKIGGRSVHIKVANGIPKNMKLHTKKQTTSSLSGVDINIERFQLLVGKSYPLFYKENVSLNISESSLSLVWDDSPTKIMASWNWRSLIGSQKLKLYYISDSTVAIIFSFSQPPFLYKKSSLEERCSDPTMNEAFGRCYSAHLIIQTNQETYESFISFLKGRNHLKEVFSAYTYIEGECVPDSREDSFAILEENLPLSIRMALRCFCNYIDPLELPEGFVELLHTYDPLRVENSLYYLTESSFSRRFSRFKSDFNDRFLEVLDRLQEEEDFVLGDQVPISRITVTPCKIKVSPKTMEQSNAVLREFRKFQDRFIRVCFTDETGGYLPRASEATGVYNRIENFVKQGIRLAGVHFEYLASSNSQLREGSAWFFASTEEISVIDIKQKLGNFESIKCVAKCCARIGQSFSNTSKSVHMGEKSYAEIDDIKSDDGKFCFSDGVGRMSRTLAELIKDSLGLEMLPSAVQFRFQGAKGMLCLSRKVPPGLLMELRPSMIKYPFHEKAEHEFAHLAICSVAKEIRCRLNAPLVMLLHGLGVSDVAFDAKLNEALATIRSSVSEKEATCKLLQEFGGVLRNSHRWENLYFDSELFREAAPSATSILMASLEHLGIREDPHLFSVLSVVRHRACFDIRKFRYPVTRGCTLVGVLDEENVLKEGEVFFSLSSGRAVPLGNVMIHRSPSLHPGDIRILELVDRPELHDIVDCVVFPACGCRPHPNEMSGGDLDGDLFHIIWDKTLFPSSEYTNLPAMDYSPPELDEVENITVELQQDHFLNYLKTDNVGLIATTHLIAAEKYGVHSEICLALATLHSKAVDFAKTGVAAQISKEHLHVLGRYPDFKEHPSKLRYRSEHIMGKLWRKAIQVEVESKENLFNLDVHYRPNSKFKVEGYQQFLYEAKNVHNSYRRELQSIRQRYENVTEAEAVTGYFSSLLTKREKKAVQVERMKLEVRTLRNKFRMLFFEEFDEKLSSAALRIKQKASAWYHTAYECSPSKVALSFPWIVGDILINILHQNSKQ